MRDVIGINLNYDIILSQWDAWRHLRKFMPLKKLIKSTKNRINRSLPQYWY